jgi:hypothetical protein
MCLVSPNGSAILLRFAVLVGRCFPPFLPVSPWRSRSRSRPRAAPPNPVATGYTIGGSAPIAVDRMIRLYPHARGAESSVDESQEPNTYLFFAPFYLFSSALCQIFEPLDQCPAQAHWAKHQAPSLRSARIVAPSSDSAMDVMPMVLG